MHENEFSAKLKAKLEMAGALVLNVHGHSMQKAGWADLQIYSPVWTGHLELKVQKRKLSALQKDVMKELNRRDFSSFCLRLDPDKDLLLENFEHEYVAGFPGFIESSGKELLLWLKSVAIVESSGFYPEAPPVHIS